jgi:hypothetical protein
MDKVRVESLKGLYFPALPANIRQGLKKMEVANTLAYYNTVTIKVKKCFIVQAPDVFTKHFRMIL